MSRQPSKAVRRLRKLGWWLHARMSDTVTVRTRQGVITFSSRDKVIGRHTFMNRGWEEAWYEQAVSFARSMCPMPPRGEGTFLDLGANVGIIGIGALLKGDFARTVAVEPDPANFRLLLRNARQNNLEGRIRCVNCALAHEEGEAILELHPRNHGDHRVRDQSSPASRSGVAISVRGRTLDAVLDECGGEWRDDPGLAWIDVQGFEGWALRGAARMRARKIPIVSELMPQAFRESGMTPQDLRELLRGTHGSVWMLHGHDWRRRPITDLPEIFVEIESRDSHDNVVFLP